MVSSKLVAIHSELKYTDYFIFQSEDNILKIMIVTQDETGYLPTAIDYLIRRIPEDVFLIGAIVLKPSPLGAKYNIFTKAFIAFRTFGASFVVKYATQLIISFFKRKSVISTFRSWDVPLIKLPGSINSQASLDLISHYDPDLIISIAANQIFKSSLINLPKKGIINLHTSLLPLYRGLLPSFWVIKNKEFETGVSVFWVDEGIDSGQIIVQEKLRILGCSQSELIRYTKILGMEAIVSAVSKIMSGDNSTIANDDSKATYYSFPTRKDVKEFLRQGSKF